MSVAMSHLTLLAIFVLCVVFTTSAIPTSVLSALKADALNNKKVKRVAEDSMPESGDDEEQKRSFVSPSAQKRGGAGNMRMDELPLLSEWDQRRFRQQQQQELDADIPRSLYNVAEDVDDEDGVVGGGKSWSQYRKGFRLGSGRGQLDQAVENAILKSEMYGDPAVLNQYQYYGDNSKKRKRRFIAPSAAAQKASSFESARLRNRYKRDADLTPEEILAVLTLWENEKLMNRNYGPRNADYNRYLDSSDNDDDENWSQTPVRPHLNERFPPSSSQQQSNYWYEHVPQQQQYIEKRGRWGGLHANNNKKKRFMVAKRSVAAPSMQKKHFFDRD